MRKIDRQSRTGTVYGEAATRERGGLIEITDEAGNTRSELIRKDAVDGKDVQLTISSAEQKKLYQTLAGGGDAGAMVLMNPKDGNMLALVRARLPTIQIKWSQV